MMYEQQYQEMSRESTNIFRHPNRKTGVNFGGERFGAEKIRVGEVWESYNIED